MTTTRSASDIPTRRQETPSPQIGKKPLGAAETTVYDVDDSAEELDAAEGDGADDEYWDDEEQDKDLEPDQELEPDDDEFEDALEPVEPQPTPITTPAIVATPTTNQPPQAAPKATAKINPPKTKEMVTYVISTTNPDLPAKPKTNPVQAKPKSNPMPVDPSIIPEYLTRFEDKLVLGVSRMYIKAEKRHRNYVVVQHQKKHNLLPSDLQAKLHSNIQATAIHDESAELYTALQNEEAGKWLALAKDVHHCRGEIHGLATTVLTDHIISFTTPTKIKQALIQCAIKNGATGVDDDILAWLLAKIDRELTNEKDKYDAKCQEQLRVVNARHKVYMARLAAEQANTAREATATHNATPNQRNVPITNFFDRVHNATEDNRSAKNARRHRQDTPIQHQATRNPIPSTPAATQPPATRPDAPSQQALEQRLAALEREQNAPRQARPSSLAERLALLEQEHYNTALAMSMNHQTAPPAYSNAPIPYPQLVPQAPMEYQPGGYWAPNPDTSMPASSSRQHAHLTVNTYPATPNANHRPNVSFQTPKRRHN